MAGDVHFRVVGASDVHFRPVGRITGWLEAAPAQLRSVAGDRTLLGRLVPWHTPTRIISEGFPTYLEWFARGAVDLRARPRLTLRHLAHGGHVVGETLALFDEPLGLNGLLEVAEGRLGDGVLGLIDRNDRVPLSVGFKPLPGGDRQHPGLLPGVERTAVDLFEVAIVEAGAYADAHVIGRVPRPSNAEIASRVTDRLLEMV